MDQSPIVQSWQLLRKNPERSTILFYGVLLAMTLCIVSINFLPGMQKSAMRKFHYIPRPFYQWALWQFLPSMYNFHNEVLIAPRMLVADFQAPNDADVLRFTVNHYPFRILSFGLSRSEIFLRTPVFVYTRSVFRGESITSSYELTRLGYFIRVNFSNAYERSVR